MGLAAFSNWKAVFGHSVFYLSSLYVVSFIDICKLCNVSVIEMNVN